MQLPGRSGHELLAEIRADPRTRLIPVMMITGAATHETKLRAIEAGVTDFIAKPFSAEELVARARALLELKFVTDALEDAEQVIILLARTIDARDRYTYGHSARVSLYAGLLGERIGLEGRALATVRRGASSMISERSPCGTPYCSSRPSSPWRSTPKSSGIRPRDATCCET